VRPIAPLGAHGEIYNLYGESMEIKKAIVAISIVALLAVSLAAFFNRDVLEHFLFSSETIGSYEIAAMRTARANNEASTILVDNDIEVHFLLPNGAVAFENSAYPLREGFRQYLVTAEAFGHYLHELLPQNGYEYEQMGAMFYINNEDNSVRVEMFVSMFTREFMRLELWSRS